MIHSNRRQLRKEADRPTGVDYRRGMRRLLAGLSSFAVALGALVVMATPASAADVGTVTVSYNMGYSVTPTTLSASAGDTFTLTQTLSDNASSYVSLVNGTGAVSFQGSACTSTSSCPVLDDMSSPHASSGIFTVVSEGTVTVNRYLFGTPGTNSTIATLTITVGSGSSVTDPALVYPTMYLDANSGTCTGTMQYTKVNGMNGTVTLPTAEQCTRAGYTFAGWARSSSATSRVFAPGAVVPIGDESFTLFAVWTPVGVEVTYGAGVADGDDCLVDDTSTSVRVSTVVVPMTGSLATQAPCSPPLMVLSGWRDLSSGTVFAPGEALSKLGAPTGSRVSLAAQWKVTYGLSIEASAATIAPEAVSTVRVTATVNGTPVSGATVEVAVPASSPLALTGGSTPVRVTTNAAGQAQVIIAARPGRTGTGTVTAAFGDRVSSVDIVVEEKTAAAVIIVGERGTVGGKPGIIVSGLTTGLPAGSTVIPYFRFPGETSYTQTSARPVVDADGEFTWQRKTGKKVYAYVVTESGVASNRVIIPSN